MWGSPGDVGGRGVVDLVLTGCLSHDYMSDMTASQRLVQCSLYISIHTITLTSPGNSPSTFQP